MTIVRLFKKGMSDFDVALAFDCDLFMEQDRWLRSLDHLDDGTPAYKFGTPGFAVIFERDDDAIAFKLKFGL